jgi:hypothetical protein
MYTHENDKYLLKCIHLICIKHIAFDKNKNSFHCYTNLRKTDNTMAKGKKTKGQTMFYKAIHRKLKIDEYEPHKK